MFEFLKNKIYTPLKAEIAKQNVNAYFADKNNWDSVTINKIIKIEQKINKLSSRGISCYYEDGSYYGENLRAIRTHFEDNGYRVIECRNWYTNHKNIRIEITW